MEWLNNTFTVTAPDAALAYCSVGYNPGLRMWENLSGRAMSPSVFTQYRVRVAQARVLRNTTLRPSPGVAVQLYLVADPLATGFIEMLHTGLHGHQKPVAWAGDRPMQCGILWRIDQGALAVGDVVEFTIGLDGPHTPPSRTSGSFGLQPAVLDRRSLRQVGVTNVGQVGVGFIDYVVPQGCSDEITWCAGFHDDPAARDCQFAVILGALAPFVMHSPVNAATGVRVQLGPAIQNSKPLLLREADYIRFNVPLLAAGQVCTIMVMADRYLGEGVYGGYG
jgi:hypothetical protein